MKLESYMQQKKEIIEHYLREKLSFENEKPSLIHRSIRYSVFNGGKRIRPILTMMAAQLLDQSYEKVLPTAAGIELIHTFSLVHDDLPCMDNDDYRRGKQTNHKVFGEAIALLSGDALLVMGLNFILQNTEIRGISKESVIRVLQDVLEMLGTGKMLGGQVDDISWGHQKTSPDNPDKIEDIYLKKTSALICTSLKAGGWLSKAGKEQIKVLDQYGEKIGLAFQITDDLFDLSEDKENEGVPNYPKIFGIKKSKETALRYSKQAKEIISSFGKKAQLFYELADFVTNRQQ